MKHILRKLHIGGNHEAFDGRNQVAGALASAEHQDVVVASTSSGLSGWLANARHTFLPSSSTPQPKLGSANSSSSVGHDSPRSEAPVNFNYYEEEYQVQLALALSVSNQSGLDGSDALQIRLAKRISLGRPSSLGSISGESIAHRYWNYNVLDYDEKVVDGFYDVYGMVTAFGTVENMPSLVDLQSTTISDMISYEVVLVNRATDQGLVHLEHAAVCLAVDCEVSGISQHSHVLVQKIANLVVENMGGPVCDANDMLRLWVTNRQELRASLNNIVLPLGCLKIGLSRHRALLFKVLADHVNIPCRLVKGSYYTGTDEGAVNIVKLGSESEYIVDLMGAPGTLLPAEAVGAGLNADLFENTALVEELFSQIDKSQNHLNGVGEATNERDSNEKCQYDIVASRVHEGKLAPGPMEVLIEKSKETKFASETVVDYHDSTVIPGATRSMSETNVNFNIEEIGKDFQDKAKIQMQNIHERIKSGYMERWKKHVNNKGDPVLENVAEWEIPWEEIIIGERIGLGSYGEVHHGDWHGTEVAVKRFLDQDFLGDALDQFVTEVQIMRCMQHPNIVLFLGAVTRPPNLSIVTEYVPRGSLFRLLHRPNCQIDEELRLKMALDVAEGMNYLHMSKPIIVHRDLKTPNLLVDRNWVVKVCDFGLSRLKHHTFLSSKSTAGTPEWMAPEMLRNELSNEKCDVYSFGVILWELCTLQPPWSGMNPMQVVGAVGFRNHRLEIPKHIDPCVARIISNCWLSEPKLRPSFSELIVSLKSLERLLKD